MPAPNSDIATSPARRRVEMIVLVALVMTFVMVNWFIFPREDENGMPLRTREMVGLIMAAGLTLIMYSFLYRDNPLFKVAENLYVGVAMGYEAIVAWRLSLRPEIVDPLFRPVSRHAFWYELAWRAIPIILGLLLLTRLSKKHSWLSRYAYALFVGWAAGLAIFAETDSKILTQLQATLAPLQQGISSGPWLTHIAMPILGTVILLVGTVCVLFYFFFSVKHERTAGVVSQVGIWFLMVAFGAMFGYTVMGRLALLIDRFDFLMFDWLTLSH